MVKRIISSVCLSTIICCTKVYHFPSEDVTQQVIDDSFYTFKKKLDADGIKKIDTTILYVQIFDSESNDEERANPRLMKFHNDGYFQSRSRRTIGKDLDIYRTKKSQHYGGKYYLDKDAIFIEAFYPTTGGKSSNYTREISKGRIYGDTISLNIFGYKMRFVKLPMSK